MVYMQNSIRLQYKRESRRFNLHRIQNVYRRQAFPIKGINKRSKIMSASNQYPTNRRCDTVKCNFTQETSPK